MQIKLQLKRRNRQRGQGLVEFALAFPVFLLIVLGIFEFGRVFVTYTALYAASREGARFGAAAENVVNGCAGVESQVQRVGFFVGNVDVLIQHDSGPGTPVASGCGTKLGDRVIVKASIPFKSVTGIIPAFTMESVARRTIIKEVRLIYTLVPPGAATAIPQSTNTPGPTPTETPYGTPPAAEPTVTPTTAGVCDGTIEWSANDSKSSVATFTNNSGSQYTLTQIIVTWENPDPTLNEVIYIGSGYDPLTSILQSSPATIDVPNWVVGTGPSLFEFIFSQSNAKFLGVQLIMEDEFGVSCVVQ